MNLTSNLQSLLGETNTECTIITWQAQKNNFQIQIP